MHCYLIFNKETKRYSLASTIDVDVIDRVYTTTMKVQFDEFEIRFYLIVHNHKGQIIYRSVENVTPEIFSKLNSVIAQKWRINYD